MAITLSAKAQKPPGKKEILAKMTLANEYFMKSWPDPGKEIVTNKTRPDNIWPEPFITSQETY